MPGGVAGACDLKISIGQVDLTNNRSEEIIAMWHFEYTNTRKTILPLLFSIKAPKIPNIIFTTP